MFNKEDFQNNYDLELYAATHVIDKSVEDEVNLHDTPLELYKICFPNERKPIEKLTEIYRSVFASYLTKKNKLSIKEIERIVTTSKRGTSKSEMDIAVKTVIEGEFQVILEMETDVSMDIIHSTPVEELTDTTVMREKLTFISKEPCELSDYALYNSKLITGRQP